MVRVRVIEYLAAHVVPGVRRYGGQVPVDATVPAMAHDLGLSPHDVVETLWNLQKNQVVTFRERKGPGRTGAIITKIRLAESATNGLPVEAVTTRGEAIDQAIDILEVTEAILSDGSAVLAFPGTTCRARKVAPEWCVEHDSLWTRGDMHCTAEWARLNPVTDEVGVAVAQYDTSLTTSPEVIVDDLPALLVPPLRSAYPAILALLAERGAQDAANRAANILIDAGLEDLATTVADAIRSFTPLEEEVLRLAEGLGWMESDD
jgi:hypothetical protein